MDTEDGLYAAAAHGSTPYEIGLMRLGAQPRMEHEAQSKRQRSSHSPHREHQQQHPAQWYQETGPFRGMMQSYAAPPHGYVAPISAHMQQQQRYIHLGMEVRSSKQQQVEVDNARWMAADRVLTGRPEGGNQVENSSADTPRLRDTPLMWSPTPE